MKTVLVVDDDSEVRNILKLLLSADGLRVLEAENGDAALALAREYIPDLIISDVMMDKVNGFMLIRFLSGRPIHGKDSRDSCNGESTECGRLGHGSEHRLSAETNCTR